MVLKLVYYKINYSHKAFGKKPDKPDSGDVSCQMTPKN